MKAELSIRMVSRPQQVRCSHPRCSARILCQVYHRCPIPFPRVMVCGSCQRWEARSGPTITQEAQRRSGIYDQNRTPARSWRVQTSVEHQFGRSTVVQLAYVGWRNTNITLDGGANTTRTYSSGSLTATAVPGSFYTGGNQPNSAANNLLNSKVPNPFYLANLSSLQTSNPVLYNLLSKSSYHCSDDFGYQPGAPVSSDECSAPVQIQWHLAVSGVPSKPEQEDG
jgi:hypothetical protein